VQVFQHQDEWPLGGERFHGFGHLPQHPFPCRPESPTLQHFEVGGTEEGGHLHQPTRGMLAQERYEVLPLWPPTQPSEGLQHRQISFSSPILFDALSVTDPQRPLGPHALYEGFYQSGFANASFPGHESYLPLALQGFYQPPL
jgi:hypothetical protein